MLKEKAQALQTYFNSTAINILQEISTPTHKLLDPPDLLIHNREQS